MTKSTKFVICICTYQRPELLSLLLNDIACQTVEPGAVIVVDGDSPSGEVYNRLVERSATGNSKFIYVPSNHGNLSYQRYLGWKAASSLPGQILLYLDDDLRILQLDAIEQILIYLRDNPDVAGATAVIQMGPRDQKFSSHQVLSDRPVNSNHQLLIRLFGSSRKILAGQITPIGDRILPVLKKDQSYADVHWLRGGVMAYKMSALIQDCFSADLFALDHIKCGKGEDTFLSRRVSCHGRLILVQSAVFDHPNNDLPKTYPISAVRYGYALAYSRRFLNDHYRIIEPPHFFDRLALLKSYLGNSLVNFIRAIFRPKRFRFEYAWGYFLGSMRGLLVKPTAKNLTPDIDWWQDAEEALSHTMVIQ